MLGAVFSYKIKTISQWGCGKTINIEERHQWTMEISIFKPKTQYLNREEVIAARYIMDDACHYKSNNQQHYLLNRRPVHAQN